MFESNLIQDESQQRGSRRAFLLSASTVAGALVVWSLRPSTAPLMEREPTGPVLEVDIVEFSPTGKPMGTLHQAKIVKSEAAWRRQLSANAFDIARRADTEMAYTGAYWNGHERGIYRCVCCETALFSSETKFDSGTGWPSFWAPIAKQNVTEKEDRSWGERTAVACTLCDAHLGHVFNDGPPPTGARYCMNSASLVFRVKPSDVSRDGAPFKPFFGLSGVLP